MTECSSNTIISSALEVGGWSAPRPGHFSPDKETQCQCTVGGWASPTAGFESPRSVSLHRLRYSGRPSLIADCPFSKVFLIQPTFRRLTLLPVICNGFKVMYGDELCGRASV